MFNVLQQTPLDKAWGDKYSLCRCCSNTTALWSPMLPQLTRPGSDGDDTSLPHTTPSLVYDFHRWLHNQQDWERYWTPTHKSSHRGNTPSHSLLSLSLHLSFSLRWEYDAQTIIKLFQCFGCLIYPWHSRSWERCLGHLSQVLWRYQIMWV